MWANSCMHVCVYTLYVFLFECTCECIYIYDGGLGIYVRIRLCSLCDPFLVHVFKLTCAKV